MSTKPPPQPWERQEAETEEAWAAFRTYRDMPPDARMMTRAATRSTATLSKWFNEHGWAARCREYDAKFDSIRVEEREAMYRRQAQQIAIDHMLMLSDARELVQREVAKWTAASRDSAMHGLVKVADLTKLFEMVVKLDRLVRGETTENVGSKDLNYANLSTDELDTLNALLDKACKEADPTKAPPT